MLDRMSLYKQSGPVITADAAKNMEVAMGAFQKRVWALKSKSS